LRRVVKRRRGARWSRRRHVACYSCVMLSILPLQARDGRKISLDGIFRRDLESRSEGRPSRSRCMGRVEAAHSVKHGAGAHRNEAGHRFPVRGKFGQGTDRLILRDRAVRASSRVLEERS
jgi:hypothetical protein